MKQRLCCSRTESFNSFFLQLPINIRGSWWHIGWFDAFRSERRRFESHSSRHARDLGQVLRYIIYNIYCVYCIRLPVALRRVNSDTVNYCGRERLWVVVDSKRRYRNIRIEWMNIISPFVCGRCDNGGACFYVWIHACMHECMYIFVIGVDLSKILGGARSGQSAMTDDIIGASGAT